MLSLAHIATTALAVVLRGRRRTEIENFQTLIKLRTNMKFSHFVELITLNKPTDELYI